MRRLCFLLAFVALFAAAPVRGQAVASKEPSSTHIFPAGGRRGTVVPVRVGGECLPPGARFSLWGDGVHAPDLLGPRAKVRFEPSPRRLPLDANFINYPKEWASEITIAADAPLGPCFWRVTTGWGGTQVRPFLVGDLPEHVETEPNSSPELAERVRLPVVINGQIAGERDIDYFTFAARAGQTVVCDVMASRIGSPLEAVIELRDSRGRKLSGDDVRVGNDPVVGFRIPEDGDYSLLVSNLGVGGGPEYVYRVTVTTSPYAYSAFPAGGRAGETRAVEFLTLTGTGTPAVLKQNVTFPKNDGKPFWYRGIPGGNPILLAAGNLPEVTAPGTNHAAATAMPLTAPVAVSGRFQSDNEEDWYRFTARQGEAFTIHCRPFPPGSPAVPLLALEDAAGNVLARCSGVDSPVHRSTLEWRAPAGGEYRLRLRDLQFGSRGGPDFVYRLTIRPAEPDFALALAKDAVNVTQGGREEVEVVVARIGGFTGPIRLDVAGLPAGVRVENPLVPENATRHRLALVAAADAPTDDAVLRVTGTAVNAPKVGSRVATAVPLGLDAQDMSPATPSLSELRLAVQHKPLFRLTCSEAYQYAHRGTVYPYRMQAERLNGFDGEIHVQLCDRQVQDLDGVDAIEQVIPRGAKEFDNLIYFPETMHASVQHHSRPYVQGYATFTDSRGRQQTILAVADRRCMVRTRPPVTKLRAAEEQVHARPGAPAEFGLVLDRTSNFGGAMRVELIEAPPGVSLHGGTAEIPAGGNAVTVKLDVGSSVNRATTPLKFRATGRMEGGATVVSEAVVTLKWQ
jgi:hypothetical protein